MRQIQISVLDQESDITPTIWYKSDAGLFDATSGGNPVTENGSVVRRVEDQSGNGLHATNSNGPILTLNQLNGYPSLKFNGVSTTLLTLPNMSSYTQGTSIVVWKFNDAAVANYWDMGATDNGAIWWNVDSGIYETHGTNARKTTGVLPSYLTWLNTFRIYSVQGQPGFFTTTLANRPYYRTNSNTVAFRAAPVIGKNIFSQYANIDLVEYRFYSTPPSVNSMNKIFKKLADRYALAAT